MEHIEGTSVSLLAALPPLRPVSSVGGSSERASILAGCTFPANLHGPPVETSVIATKARGETMFPIKPLVVSHLGACIEASKWASDVPKAAFQLSSSGSTSRVSEIRRKTFGESVSSSSAYAHTHTLSLLLDAYYESGLRRSSRAAAASASPKVAPMGPLLSASTCTSALQRLCMRVPSLSVVLPLADALLRDESSFTGVPAPDLLFSSAAIYALETRCLERGLAHSTVRHIFGRIKWMINVLRDRALFLLSSLVLNDVQLETTVHRSCSLLETMLLHSAEACNRLERQHDSFDRTLANLRCTPFGEPILVSRLSTRECNFLFERAACVSKNVIEHADKHGWTDRASHVLAMASSVLVPSIYGQRHGASTLLKCGVDVLMVALPRDHPSAAPESSLLQSGCTVAIITAPHKTLLRESKSVHLLPPAEASYIAAVACKARLLGSDRLVLDSFREAAASKSRSLMPFASTSEHTTHFRLFSATTLGRPINGPQDMRYCSVRAVLEENKSLLSDAISKMRHGHSRQRALQYYRKLQCASDPAELVEVAFEAVLTRSSAVERLSAELIACCNDEGIVRLMSSLVPKYAERFLHFPFGSTPHYSLQQQTFRVLTPEYTASLLRALHLSKLGYSVDRQAAVARAVARCQLGAGEISPEKCIQVLLHLVGKSNSAADALSARTDTRRSALVREGESRATKRNAEFLLSSHASLRCPSLMEGVEEYGLSAVTPASSCHLPFWTKAQRKNFFATNGKGFLSSASEFMSLHAYVRRRCKSEEASVQSDSERASNILVVGVLFAYGNELLGITAGIGALSFILEGKGKMVATCMHWESVFRAGDISHSLLLKLIRLLVLLCAWYEEEFHSRSAELTRESRSNAIAVASCIAPLHQLRGRLNTSRPGGHVASRAHLLLCDVFGGLDVDEFAAKQKVESMVMEDILSRLLADVHTFGTAPMDPGSRGDLARLALLPDVLLCLFLSTGGMLDMSIPLVVGDTLRPMLSEDGTVRLEVIPPWTNDAPRSILLPHASQAALRWLLLRAPHTRSLSVFAGLRWPKGLMRG